MPPRPTPKASHLLGRRPLGALNLGPLRVRTFLQFDHCVQQFLRISTAASQCCCPAWYRGVCDANC